MSPKASIITKTLGSQAKPWEIRRHRYHSLDRTTLRYKKTYTYEYKMKVKRKETEYIDEEHDL